MTRPYLPDFLSRVLIGERRRLGSLAAWREPLFQPLTPARGDRLDHGSPVEPGTATVEGAHILWVGAPVLRDGASTAPFGLRSAPPQDERSGVAQAIGIGAPAFSCPLPPAHSLPLPSLRRDGCLGRAVLAFVGDEFGVAVIAQLPLDAVDEDAVGDF